MMNKTKHLIKEIVADAMQPGPQEEPTALLEALQEKGAPLKVFMRTDEDRMIEKATAQDFGFLQYLYMRSEATKRDAKKRQAALIRWILDSSKRWKENEDKGLRTLVAILLTSRRCGGEAGLWHMLPDESGPSAEFLSVLSSLVSKLQISYDIPESPEPPIWEREFVEAFKKADATCDWSEIANRWQQFSNAVWPAPLLEEMVRCLASYKLKGLVQATNSIQQSPSAMQIARMLHVSQRLRLALATDSNHIRFCCAFTTVSHQTGAEELSVDEEACLSDLLVQVSTSTDEWIKWMATFNTYPLRYPLLYRALGNALAKISQEAALTFIDTIQLHPIRVNDMDESRELISECLRAFKQQAIPEYRQALWTSAYQHWLDWRFDKNNPNTNLFEINRSPLDYAVVSYIHECQREAEREAALEKLQNQFSNVELAWHTTETTCTTEWNRLLSVYQLYVHAYKIAETGEDALPNSCIYYPSNLAGSLYHKIMFRVPTYQ